jgi:hypothetical protein
MRWRTTVFSFAAAGLLAAVPSGASAQAVAYAFMPEIYYGLGVGAEFIGNNSDLDVCALATESGAEHCQQITELTGVGFDAFIGSRFGPYFGAELTYDAFFHSGSGEDPYNLATLQAVRGDLKVFLMPGSGFEPYLQGGAGLYLIGDEYGFAKAGGGFQLGGGVDFYLAPMLSLGANVLYRGIYFGQFDVDQSDLPWASSEGDVKEGFIHNVFAVLNATLHQNFY